MFRRRDLRYDRFFVRASHLHEIKQFLRRTEVSDDSVVEEVVDLLVVGHSSSISGPRVLGVVLLPRKLG